MTTCFDQNSTFDLTKSIQMFKQKLFYVGKQDFKPNIYLVQNLVFC